MNDEVRNNDGARWLWIVAIWTGVGLFDATQTVFSMRAEGMHHAWGALFFVLLVSWIAWALVTPMIMRLGRRYPPIRLRPVRNWAVHFSAWVTICVMFSTWSAWLWCLLNPYAYPAGPGSFLSVWQGKLYSSFLSVLVLYGFVVAVTYALDSRERLARHETETARLNEQLSKAQLNALRRQIEPHFLFNTLNAISGLVREKRSDAAVSMIARLSEFLRQVVADSSRQQVTLGEEVEFLQKYLDIQKARFAERLQLNIEVPRELLSAEVPALLLQPIVENAVKHGIAKRACGGGIRVSAFRRNGTLNVSVYNDGPGLAEPEEPTSSGVGISNLRTRLQGLYGDEYGFTMNNQESGVVVSVSMPYQESIEKG